MKIKQYINIFHTNQVRQLLRLGGLTGDGEGLWGSVRYDVTVRGDPIVHPVDIPAATVLWTGF